MKEIGMVKRKKKKRMKREKRKENIKPRGPSSEWEL